MARVFALAGAFRPSKVKEWEHPKYRTRWGMSFCCRRRSPPSWIEEGDPRAAAALVAQKHGRLNHHVCVGVHGRKVYVALWGRRNRPFSRRKCCYQLRWICRLAASAEAIRIFTSPGGRKRHGSSMIASGRSPFAGALLPAPRPAPHARRAKHSALVTNGGTPLHGGSTAFATTGAAARPVTPP